MNLTVSQEEYLKTIYILSKTEKEIRVTDIAQKLGITKPSVNRAIKGLKTLNLLNYETYGNISLTAEGEKISQEILKKEDLLKLFLINVLGVEKDKATKEANAMKHAISEETEQKMEEYVNKILELGKLDCDYDANNEKCKNCIKITIKNRLKETT